MSKVKEKVLKAKQNKQTKNKKKGTADNEIESIHLSLEAKCGFFGSLPVLCI